MKLFMVFLIGGISSGVIGPLPYDETECQSRADDLKLEVTQACADDSKRAEIDGISISLCGDFEVICTKANMRPLLGDRFAPKAPN